MSRTSCRPCREWVRAQRPKLYSRELVDVLFNQPYCRIHNVVDAGSAKRETAARYLRELVDIGVLSIVFCARAACTSVTAERSVP